MRVGSRNSGRGTGGSRRYETIQHQLLEALAVTVGPRLAKIAVDDHDAFPSLAQGNGALTERVLARCQVEGVGSD